MAERKMFLHYADRKVFVTDSILDRLRAAVEDSGTGTAWLDVYGRGGAGGDDDVTIVVGAGIPMLIESELPDYA